MTDADPEDPKTDAETPEEPEERDTDAPEPEETDLEDDQPEIEPDETADVEGLDLDDAELDPDPESDSSDESEDSGETGTTDSDEGDEADDLEERGGRWGDMYVKTLTRTTNRVIEKHGDEDSQKIDEEHFTEIDLDRHFNETMEKFSGTSEMEPEQALVIGSLVGVAGPIALETDLLSELSEEIKQ